MFKRDCLLFMWLVKNFTKSNKMLIKVRDHCHYASKQGGAANLGCNLRCKK